MQKKILMIYFTIFAVLLLMMSVSRHTSDKMRGQSVAVMTPLWEKILSFTSHPLSLTHFSVEEENQRLELDNKLLEIEIAYLQEQLHEQQLLSSQMTQIAPFFPEETKTLAAQALKNALKIIQYRIQAVPARVIFRSFDTWNSFLWINKGESTNQDLQTPIIAKK